MTERILVKEAVKIEEQDILYEDKEIIVCHKKAGMATQTARLGEADMVSALKNYLKTPYLAVIHRLDQPVEGVLVFAKTKKAAAGLSRQNAGQTMSKNYYAVVLMQAGETVDSKETELVDFVLKDGKSNTSKVVSADTPGAKRAELTYQLVKVEETEDGSRKALVRVRLKTGRHHQIRVQMAHAGMPLLGDARYGNEEVRNLSRKQGIKNVALCAYHLEFLHPVSGKRMVFEIEPKGEAFVFFSDSGTVENC